MASQSATLQRTTPAPPMPQAKPAAITRPTGLEVKRLEEAWIRQRAYHKWEAAGRPPGDGVNFWLEAEREMLQTR